MTVKELNTIVTMAIPGTSVKDASIVVDGEPFIMEFIAKHNGSFVSNFIRLRPDKENGFAGFSEFLVAMSDLKTASRFSDPLFNDLPVVISIAKADTDFAVDRVTMEKTFRYDECGHVCEDELHIYIYS